MFNKRRDCAVCLKDTSIHCKKCPSSISFKEELDLFFSKIEEEKKNKKELERM